MRTVAIIQARLGSSRLPGKVLLDVAGKSVLAHVIERVRAAQRLDDIMVATTEETHDFAVAEEARRCQAEVFRGSEGDVLARYYGAARTSAAEVIVRVTADCPLFDPVVLDQMLGQFQREADPGNGPDYLSNTLTRTFPRGLDAEIFTFAALEVAAREAAEAYERENVTLFIYHHPKRFRLRAFERSPDLSGLRWTLDTPEDWDFIKAVYEALYAPNELFGTEDVLELLRRKPELALLNAHVEQKKLEH